MSTTPKMLHRRRQALARLAALRFDLDETLHIEPPASDPSLYVGRAWAELLCPNEHYPGRALTMLAETATPVATTGTEATTAAVTSPG